jgi:hypothetical protein
MAEARKGFSRRGPLGFGDGDSQGFPTLTLRAWEGQRRSLGIVIFGQHFFTLTNPLRIHSPELDSLNDVSPPSS